MAEPHPEHVRKRALELVAEGMSDRAVGRELGVDFSTIGRWRAKDVIDREAALPVSPMAQVEQMGEALQAIDPSSEKAQSYRARALRAKARFLATELVHDLLEEDRATRGTDAAKPDYVRIAIAKVGLRSTESLQHLDEPPPEDVSGHKEKVNDILRGLTKPVYEDDPDDE